MFTGIITDVGTVRSVEQRGDLRLVIGTAYDLSTVDLGASIACSGACLTVVDKGSDWFAVDVSQETVSKTVGDHWQVDARLNLERALRMGDELGGHLVTGHVDAVGQIADLRPEGDSTRLVIEVPRALGGMIAPKGSITVDGTSLTVNDVTDEGDVTRFSVNIIPHTSSHTTLGGLAQSSTVNIEIDVLARYISRMNLTRM